MICNTEARDWVMELGLYKVTANQGHTNRSEEVEGPCQKLLVDDECRSARDFSIQR